MTYVPGERSAMNVVGLVAGAGTRWMIWLPDRTATESVATSNEGSNRSVSTSPWATVSVSVGFGPSRTKSTWRQNPPPSGCGQQYEPRSPVTCPEDPRRTAVGGESVVAAAIVAVVEDL